MTETQFDKLIEVLGQLGSQAYALAYRQVLVEAFMEIFVGVLCLVITVAAAHPLWRVLRTNYESPSDKEDKALVPAIITFVAGGGSLVAFLDAASRLANPGWHALWKLASLV